MRYWSVVLLMSWPSPAWADVPFVIRPLDSASAAAIDSGARRSPMIRALMAELDTSNAIVHVETVWELLPRGIGGATQLVTTQGDHVYIRVRIAAQLPLRERAVTLGHELQHVREIVRSRARRDDELRAWLDTSGYCWQQSVCETSDAVRIEKLVRSELMSRPAGTRRAERE